MQVEDVHGATSFTDSGTSPLIVQALFKAGFQAPTPVQHKMLLYNTQHPESDVLLQAKSGSGKTIAYLAVALQQLFRVQVQNKQAKRVLILAPTRQLAMQIHGVINSINLYESVLAVGGLPLDDNWRALMSPFLQLIVGTVGRVQALISENRIPLSSLSLIILDEADKLLTSFSHFFSQLFTQLPPSIRLLFVSATFPPDVQSQLPSKRKFERVQNSIQMEVVGITKFAFISSLSESMENYSLFNRKMNLLTKTLSELKFIRCLVFVERKALLQQLYQGLRDAGQSPLLIHGSLSQAARIRAINQAPRHKLIISSDLLARGIDIPLDFVILFDSLRPDTLYHRVGRTGRHGRKGVVVSLDPVPLWTPYSAAEVQQCLLGVGVLPQPVPLYPQTETGQWKDYDPSHEDLSLLTYRYVETNLSQNHHQLMQQTEFKTEEDFIAAVRSIFDCAVCRQTISQMESVTKYTMQLRKYLPQSQTQQ